MPLLVPPTGLVLGEHSTKSRIEHCPRLGVPALVLTLFLGVAGLETFPPDCALIFLFEAELR